MTNWFYLTKRWDTSALLFKFMAVCLSIFGGFLVCEIALRIFLPQGTGPIQYAHDPVLGAIPVPYQHGERSVPGNFCYTYTNNSQGFRGSKEFKLKNTNRRVLFLGDSFTYGLGVNDDQTFCFHVEKSLADLGVEIINTGNPGKGMDYELKLFSIVGRKYHPDIVALCFIPDTFNRNSRGEYYSYQDGRLVPKSFDESITKRKMALANIPGYNFAITHSHLANLLKQTAINYIYHNRSNEIEKEGPSEEDVEITRRLYAQLIKECENIGSTLIFFYIPWITEVEAYRQNRALSKWEMAIKRIVDDDVGQFLSLTPAFVDSGQPVDRFYFAEGHWTVLAHSLAANFISKHIRAVLSLRSSCNQIPVQNR